MAAYHLKTSIAILNVSLLTTNTTLFLNLFIGPHHLIKFQKALLVKKVIKSTSVAMISKVQALSWPKFTLLFSWGRNVRASCRHGVFCFQNLLLSMLGIHSTYRAYQPCWLSLTTDKCHLQILQDEYEGWAEWIVLTSTRELFTNKKYRALSNFNQHRSR